MKKALSSKLRSEEIDAEVCQGFTTNEVKAALRNINPTKAAAPDKVHPWFLHHLSAISSHLSIHDIFPTLCTC